MGAREETGHVDFFIRGGEWVVVCDGAKALVLQNAGDSKSPDLRTVEVLEQKDPATHEQGTDRPGRAVGSVGSMRSAVSQTDWHDRSEHGFLVHLARHLDAAVASGKTKSVIMVAPPRALGVLREAYSDDLRNAVRAEIDKDFVKVPVDEIAAHLTAG